MRYITRNWIRWDMWGTLLVFLRIPVTVALPVVTALVPKTMVDSIQSGTDVRAFVQILAVLSLGVLALALFDKVLEAHLQAFQAGISMHYAVEMMEKLLHLQYETLESYEGRTLYQRCKKFAFEGANADGAWAAVRLVGLLTSVVGIVTYSALFSRVSPWLLVIIFASCVLEYYSYYKAIQYGNRTENEMAKGEMQFFYFYRLATDPEAGKDIRLGGAAGWLLRHLEGAVREYLEIMHWYTKKVSKLTVLQMLCTILRDGASFAFIIAAVLQGSLQMGDFLFYFTLTVGFSDWLNDISGHIVSLSRIAWECDHYRVFMELPESESGAGKTRVTDIERIEFRHVSFAYPSGEAVLRDINLVFHAGENIAIVGENGAGKTTLIKLLCGLYRPTEGTILINGTDLKDLDMEQYFCLTSAIFQDYMVLPASIWENITLGAETSKEEVEGVLRQVGLEEKLGQIGFDTKLGKRLDTEALALSGGETQRLLLARALFKKAPLLILDEPAAALDSIAEEQLYLNYRDLTEERLSVFISHRLNSTRFCDRILYLSHGQVLEEGSHEQLLARGGAYKKMFDVQGRYYHEGVEF
ncbi:ABC transporter ATP-binding protein [Roseburia hominis]